VITLINKSFEKLVKENTRSEFNEKFKVLDLTDSDEECFVLINTKDDTEIDCPYIKHCELDDDCK
jgi:hypothetical protein